jgi:hypothetical protein
MAHAPDTSLRIVQILEREERSLPADARSGQLFTVTCIYEYKRSVMVAVQGPDHCGPPLHNHSTYVKVK